MKHNLRERARQLRQEGMSVRKITQMLGVSKSSVSMWTQDIKLTEEQIENLKSGQAHYGTENAGGRANRDKFLELRKSYQEEGLEKAKEGRPLHMMGCMLYWAEGAKIKNGIYFVNSDPNMIVLFARFLREELNVQDKDIALRIHCHTSDPDKIRRIESYWLELLSLANTCLKKTFIKSGESTRHNRLTNGICDIRVHNTHLVQHIYGAIQEYGGFENPAWLD